MQRISDIVPILRDTFTQWRTDNTTHIAASLAYFTIFSMAPLLLVAIYLVGIIYGQQAVRGEIVGQIRDTVGSDAARVIQDMVANTYKSGSGTIATLIGIGTVLFGATGLFAQLKDALNTIWGVAPDPDRGVKGAIRDRLLAFTALPMIGLVLLAALVANSALSAVDSTTSGILPGTVSVVFFQVLSLAVTFVMVSAVFAFIYKVLPDVQIAWRDVLVGAGVTGVLFIIGQLAISFYLGRGSATSAYGAAGSLIAVLLWVYYSSHLIIFGAEFTQVYAEHVGASIRPAEHAVWITEEVRSRPDVPSQPQTATQESSST